MVDYTKLAATCLRLITKNGKSITVNQLAIAPADVTKPWRGPTNPRSPLAATQTVKAVAVPLSAVTNLGQLINKKDIPDTVSDFFLVAPGLSTPDLSDYNEVVDDEGVTSRIAFMERLRPATTTLLYVIGVEK